MKKLFLFLFLFSSWLFSYDSIEVLNPNITLHKSGYFRTDKNLSPQQACDIAKTNALQEFTKTAYSTGITTDTYWFMFEISTRGDEKLYIDSKDILVGASYDMYIFDGNKLLNSYRNGNNLLIEQKDVKTAQIRFLLESSPNKLTYLIRAKNNLPLMPAFSLGNQSEVDATWTNLHNIMLISYFVGLSFLLYNIILFIITKDSSFLFYSIYIFGLLLTAISSRSYLPFGIKLTPSALYNILAISHIFIALGVTLFFSSFLKLKENFPKYKRILDFSCFLFAVSSIFYFYTGSTVMQKIYEFSSFFAIIYAIYASLKVYANGYKLGLYLAISTGVGTILIMLFVLSFLPYRLLPINTWLLTLLNQAIIWDVITLSIAVAYRIRLLEDERENLQKEKIQKAKFTIAGETIGSIAHQWRQPLAEAGATVLNLELLRRLGQNISNEKLDESIKSLSMTIKNMSQTIDTFQGFFHKNIDGHFEINSCIRSALDFIQGQLDSSDIKTYLHVDKDMLIDGSEDEFFEAMLIILNNSKDALIESNIDNPSITLSTMLRSDEVIITIEDNGGGIKIEPIESVFEPYVSTKGLNGMGIGLYTAKNIVTKMGGNITASNTKDGARFETVLPSGYKGTLGI